MATTAGRRALLSDDTWSRLPRTAADRRVVSAVLAGMAIVVAAVAVGSATGVLVPHLAYEGGSESPHAESHTIAITADITNDSPRAWKITGATVDAAGVARAVAMPAVEIPAHQRRTVRGVARVEDCAATPVAPGDANYGRSGDMQLRVQRLFATSSFTIPHVLANDMIAMACGRRTALVP